MNQDKYNKIKENFNNFLANRAPGMEEQEGSANYEEEAVSNTPQLTPEQSAAVTKTVAEWWQLERGAQMGFHGAAAEMGQENDSTLIDELRQILGNRGQMKEGHAGAMDDKAKKKDKKDKKESDKTERGWAGAMANKAKKFTKKEVDAYKADHAKDSKGNFIKKDFKKK